MPRLIMEIKEGKIVGTTTEGMKVKPLGKVEKLRRIVTRNRPNPFKGLNDPIVYPNIGK